MMPEHPLYPWAAACDLLKKDIHCSSCTTVIEGEKLQQELLTLKEDASNEDLLKCLVQLYKLCLLYESIFPRMYHDNHEATLIERITQDINRAGMFTCPAPSMIQAWRSSLRRYSLSVDNVELVLRYALHIILHACDRQSDRHRHERADFRAEAANIQRLKEIDPTSPFACFYAAHNCAMMRNPHRAMQELLPALRSLEEEEDDIKGIRLQKSRCTSGALAVT
ncbi:hypothetical protein WJX75_000995 [Coccomyxa subellipsoidea]|uniref:Uncharacterized protein n=1 Tax=Coccomyxa subellipsoidea TaxID=248742 RepID=A0ABR2YKD1_9CHLO